MGENNINREYIQKKNIYIWQGNYTNRNYDKRRYIR